MGIVVIPAYKPDEKLPRLIRDLKDAGVSSILVVNDGSGAAFDGVFREVEALGCELLIHEVNRGKGAALKTAFRHLSERGCREVVCTADADGQHLPVDIVACLKEAEAHPGALIIGGRGFTGNVPLRSRLGNAFSRHTFHLFTGVKVYDTQTGLRAFSPDLLPLVEGVKGDRYEYEMQMLCDAAKQKIPVREIRIQTVYLEDNASSHFNAFHDAMRVYGILLKNGSGIAYQIFTFLLSSGLAFLTDFLIYHLLLTLVFREKEISLFGVTVLAATLSLLIARIVSSVVNFTVNRQAVFKSDGKVWNFVGYVLLAIAVFFGQKTLNNFFYYDLNWHASLAYLVAQLICYPVSFLVQKLVIFRNKK